MTGIAIVSINKSKYSETFIRSHLEYLNDHILYLFGGYLPTRYSEDKLITEHEIIDVKKTSGDPDKRKKYSLRSELSRLLVKKKVQVVLAEYGPAGVEMSSICKEANIPLVVHFHGFDAYRNDVLNHYGKEYRDMFEIAQAVIVVSRDMQSQLEKLGCPRHKLHWIPYGIDIQLFKPHSLEKKEMQFVSCGRFVAKKGQEYILKAFKKVHDEFPISNMVMIGDGELLETCKQLAEALHLNEAVQFTGALTQPEIAKIFSESRFFVQHSIIDEHNDSEGLPLAILEAGSTGLTIIATNHAGIPDVIENGKTGCLVEEKNSDLMAEKILFLLRDPDLSITMGNALQEKIRKHYSIERYIEDLKKILSVNSWN